MVKRLAILIFLALAIMPACAHAQLQDIPDWGYVRIYLGICQLESYDANPEICGYDYAWYQVPDRSSGIKIMQYGDLWEGDLFYLEGLMSTNAEGEREIMPLGIALVESGFPLARPMYASQKALTTGLNAKGIVTKISGKVVKEIVDPYPDKAAYFFLDDGSGMETDDPGTRGIRIIDPYYGQNPPVTLGETLTLSGSLTAWTDDQGKVRPVFNRSTDGFNASPWTGTNRYKVSGKVIADPDASGQKVWVECDGGSTTAVFDATGTAKYELSLREGDYNVYARTPGYGSELWWVPVYSDYPDVDFTVSAMEQKELLDVTTREWEIKHDGTSITDGYAILRDFAGNRYPGRVIEIQTTKGQIVSCDNVTDENGKVRFKLRSSTKAETAIVSAKCGYLSSETPVYFHNVGDPMVSILSPVDGQTVSGVTTHEIVVYDTDEDGSEDIREYVLLLDGNPIGSFCPVRYDQEDGELIRRPGFNTAKFPNGQHTLSAMVKDQDGNTMVSNEVVLTFNNSISEFKTNQNELFFGRAEYTDFACDFVANQSPWVLRVFTIEDDDTETTVWTATGDQTGPVHLTWDGKVGGAYKSDIYMASLVAGPQTQVNLTMTQKVAQTTATPKTQLSAQITRTSAINSGTMPNDAWMQKQVTASYKKGVLGAVLGTVIPDASSKRGVGWANHSAVDTVKKNTSASSGDRTISRSNLYQLSRKEGSRQLATKMAWQLAKMQVAKESTASKESSITESQVILPNSADANGNGLYWQMSTSTGRGEILVAGVVSQFDWIDTLETYKEMRTVGNNALKRGIDPIYVSDMHWMSDRDWEGNVIDSNYGMDHWLGVRRGENGCNIRHFYLNTHGAQIKEKGGGYHNTVHFAETAAYPTDEWDPFPESRNALTDLHINPGMLKVIHFSVCDSMGTPAHPSDAIAKALGCRNDGAGSTFIGWQDEFKPFGPANGLGWVKGFWYYLCKDGYTSVAQAISRLNSTSNPLWWNSIHHRSRLYTDLESWITWLE